MKGYTEFEALELERQGPWLTVWFNDPERRNPLTAQRMQDLNALCAVLEEDGAVRGVTFRGRGGVFCSGGDLASFKEFAKGNASRAEIEEMSAAAGALFDRLDRLPQATIMLIEGAAMAGGIGLACSGDVVICRDDARFALSEARLGLVAAQIAPFVARRTGLSAARRLMITAVMFDGSEAGRIGLADMVCGDDDAMHNSEIALRDNVLQCAPGAIADTKRLLRNLEGCPRDDQRRIAAQCFAERIQDEEGAEGLAAFMDKRKPVWAVKDDGK